METAREEVELAWQLESASSYWPRAGERLPGFSSHDCRLLLGCQLGSSKQSKAKVLRLRLRAEGQTRASWSHSDRTSWSLGPHGQGLLEPHGPPGATRTGPPGAWGHTDRTASWSHMDRASWGHTDRASWSLGPHGPDRLLDNIETEH
ncbi:unnamed protein product [Arctogadus glacialis]